MKTVVFADGGMPSKMNVRSDDAPLADLDAGIDDRVRAYGNVFGKARSGSDQRGGMDHIVHTEKCPSSLSET